MAFMSVNFYAIAARLSFVNVAGMGGNLLTKSGDSLGQSKQPEYLSVGLNIGFDFSADLYPKKDWHQIYPELMTIPTQ